MFRFRSIKQEYLHLYEDTIAESNIVDQETLDKAEVLLDLNGNDLVA
jgi:hypothetical protein